MGVSTGCDLYDLFQFKPSYASKKRSKPTACQTIGFINLM